MLRNAALFMALAALVLISLGLVMLTSVSAFAPANQGNPAYFISRQVIWLALGLVMAAVAWKMDYHVWLEKFHWFLIPACGLMLLCFVPGIGLEINGAHRWLDFRILRLQPLEPFKICVVFGLSWWLSRHIKRIECWRYGFIYPMFMVGSLLTLCVMQEDLGSVALLFSVALVMLFVAGTRMRYLLPLPLAGFTGILMIALMMPQRRERLLAFLNPEEHATGAGWQLMNALVAFGSGGISGRGLGRSIQKMKWLPESHTDFIFPIIGEELGLTFSLLVVTAFLVFTLSAGMISCHARDPQGVVLGMGVTSLISLQAMMNVAVVTGLMPTKGIGLPFISYGGSNLLLCLFSIGLLCNIHRQSFQRHESRRAYLPTVVPERI
ncbi:MAG: putative lipid II flippase FtsW [Candidatus Methylacidiphilales bacterium]